MESVTAVSVSSASVFPVSSVESVFAPELFISSSVIPYELRSSDIL